MTEPFNVFVRSCRRALRDVVREQGQVPPKVDIVSRGQNPRRLEVRAVVLRELDPAARIREDIERWRSAFVGLARLMPAHVEVPDADPCPACEGQSAFEGDCPTCDNHGTLDRLIGLTAFSVDRTATFACRVSPFHGVGSWHPAEFGHGDIEMLRAAIFDVWAGSA